MRRPSILAAPLMVIAGCFPVTGQRAPLGMVRPLPDIPLDRQYSQEISTVGFFPLAGHVLYWGRGVPDYSGVPAKPLGRVVSLNICPVRDGLLQHRILVHAHDRVLHARMWGARWDLGRRGDSYGHVHYAHSRCPERQLGRSGVSRATILE
jgi:hypothetical protein